MRIEATEAMLAATAARYALGDLDRALAAGPWLYGLAEDSTAHVIEAMVCSVGSSCMMRPSPLERMVRDFQFYRRNVKIDPHLARLARRELAEARGGGDFRTELICHFNGIVRRYVPCMVIE